MECCTVLFQMCEPVKKLKRCKYFRDVTWTYVTYPDRQNSTQQLMHCRCPKNSVAYLIKRHAFQTPKGTGYQYSFACSPQTVSINSSVKLLNLQSTKYLWYGKCINNAWTFQYLQSIISRIKGNNISVFIFRKHGAKGKNRVDFSVFERIPIALKQMR